MTAAALESHRVPRITSYDVASVTVMSIGMVQSPNLMGTSLILPRGTALVPSAITIFILVGSWIDQPRRSTMGLLMRDIPGPGSIIASATRLSIWQVA